MDRLVAFVVKIGPFNVVVVTPVPPQDIALAREPIDKEDIVVEKILDVPVIDCIESDSIPQLNVSIADAES